MKPKEALFCDFDFRLWILMRKKRTEKWNKKRCCFGRAGRTDILLVVVVDSISVLSCLSLASFHFHRVFAALPVADNLHTVICVFLFLLMRNYTTRGELVAASNRSARKWCVRACVRASKIRQGSSWTNSLAVFILAKEKRRECGRDLLDAL